MTKIRSKIQLIYLPRKQTLRDNNMRTPHTRFWNLIPWICRNVSGGAVRYKNRNTVSKPFKVVLFIARKPMKYYVQEGG